MATFRKRGDVWQAQVARKGVRKSASFKRKADAIAWASSVEAEIFAGLSGQVLNKSVGDVLARYRDEVSVTKRGERWERLRVGLLLRDELADVRLPVLSPDHVSAWRDRRLKAVSASSVSREWALLSHAFSVAIKEWRWLKENPFKAVKRPRLPPPRDRRISQAEIDALCHALGYFSGSPALSVSSRVGAAFVFAIETAMRAGEVCKLKRADVTGSVAYLPMTKNGFSRRVALSPAALVVLSDLPELGDLFFGLKPSQVDAHFRKAKARARLDDLHFHDTRHEAITRLAQRLEVLDLARMVGIRDLRILMVYYNARAEDIAVKLAAA